MIGRLNNRRFLLLLCLILLFLRLPYTIEPFWIIDEANYASIANKLLSGGLLYQDGWDNKPPLLYFFYTSIFALFGRGNMLAIHLAIQPVIWAGIWLLFLITARQLSIQAARYASIAYVYYLASSGMDIWAANPEVFLVPVLLSSVYISLRAREGSAGLPWFVSGSLLGIGMLIKQQGGLFALMLPLVASMRDPRQANPGPAGFIWRCILGFLGFSLPVALVIVWYWQLGILSDFLEATLLFNFKVQISSIPLSQSIRMGAFTLWGYLKTQYVPLSLAMIGIGLAFHAAASPWRGTPEDGSGRSVLRHRTAILLCGWLFISLASIAPGGRFYGFYFYLVAPVIAVFISLSLELLGSKWLTLSSLLRVTIIGYLLTGPAILLYYTHSGYFMHAQKLALHIIGAPEKIEDEGLTSASIKMVSKYAAAKTASDDQIFIWGYHPQIYVLANRDFATRFNTVALQTGFIWGTIHQLSGWGVPDPSFYWIYPGMENLTFCPEDTAKWVYPGSMTKLMTELSMHPPELFIDGNVFGVWPFGAKYPIASFPALQAFLDRNYSLEATVRKYRIYRRKLLA